MSNWKRNERKALDFSMVYLSWSNRWIRPWVHSKWTDSLDCFENNFRFAMITFRTRTSYRRLIAVLTRLLPLNFQLLAHTIASVTIVLRDNLYGYVHACHSWTDKILNQIIRTKSFFAHILNVLIMECEKFDMEINETYCSSSSINIVGAFVVVFLVTLAR